ncbi:MAG TPA: methyltransferase domain-containing protein [Gemmatimonadaceae bacterium]|nr:methyltransferase domain-containing protein [Gemmatimonadaceae bacterium]
MSEHESTPSDEHIANAYDRWSEQYDRDPNATRDLDALVLREAGLRVRERDVLEIGCGTGKNTEWLAREARSVIAMDFSEGMLSRARTRVSAPNVRFVAHDVRDAWPIAAASVDVVTCNLVLEHVSVLPPIFEQAARVLRSGGQLFLSELHPFRQLLGGQARFTHEQSGETTWIPAFRHSVSEFINAGLAAGLQLRDMGERIEDGAPDDVPPRLLTLLFES